MRIWQMSTLIDIFGQISEFLTVSNRIWDALVVFSGRCKDLQVSRMEHKNIMKCVTLTLCAVALPHTAHVNSTNQ